MSGRAPDRVLDAPGVACVSLTPMLASTFKELPAGAVLELRTDDPAAREGVPAWCRLTRNPLLTTVVGPEPGLGLTADQTIFHIAKKEA